MKNIKEDEKLSVLNHSCAHLLAQAVKHLYNDAKFWVGPVIEEGFYYDIDLGDKVIKEEDLVLIEKEMKKIAKDGKRIIRHEISKDEALEMFKDDPYKIDLITRMDENENVISCYTQGDFTDLCAGPHLMKTGKVKAIGVANYDIRHLEKLQTSDIEIIPMVNQIEYHPLRTASELTNYMRAQNIKIQAYAPLCRLVPLLKENISLNTLAQKYNKSIGQIILRWHIQQGDIMPVFKSNNPLRFKENIDVFDFHLTNEEMKSIFDLDQDYKYHIESVNCPGY